MPLARASAAPTGSARVTAKSSSPSSAPSPKTVTVTVFGDDAEEGDEDLVVGLADPVGAVLAGASGHAVILDDDERGSVTLQAAGPRELHVRAGQVVVLEVRLRSDGGEPIAGGAVQWSVDGAADLLDGGVVTTDSEGRASQRVRVSQSPGLLAVRAVAKGGAGFVADPPTVLFQIEVGQPPG